MKDQVIVITGGSAGIGRAVAERVARDGAIPVLVARREVELGEAARAASPAALPIVADVTRRADVERVVSTALSRLGRIDVWINNAGRGISRQVSQLTDADIDEMVTVNVKSALYGMQAVLPHFKERRRGHIINVSSMLGRVPFFPPRSAYSAAKHFLNSLTANLRMELRADFPEIVVSLVTPGVVATDFGKNALGGGGDSRATPGAQPVDEVADVIAACVASRRADVYTRPGYQQQVVAYFAAEDLGAYEAALGGAPRPK
jgi:NADP-dependent 3-hydroxy acid dehydrogenase YdfG